MLFVSHASQDKLAIDNLLTSLRRAHRQVWLDDELGGGEAWWQTILENIRCCDVFIVALSNNLLASKPCRAELRYAQALRRPILPVQIGPVDSVRVTPLAATQIIDYRGQTPDADIRLARALQNCQAQAGPLPSPLPDEPPVPFAYLMRLAMTLANPELSHHEQAEMVAELRSRLDEECGDPAACRDIIQLMRLLRNRPDVTWRTRSEIETLLATVDADLLTPADGINMASYSGPQPVVRPCSGPQPFFSDQQPVAGEQSSAPQPAVRSSTTRAQPAVIPASGSGAAKIASRRPRAKWLLVGGAAVVVVAAVAAAAWLNRGEPTLIEIPLLGEADLNAIMGTSGMRTAESSTHRAKHTRGVIDVSPAECAGVLYPGLDRTYRGSGERQLTWKVSENRGGLGRAGVDSNHFVDQDVAVFPQNADRAVAFVQDLRGQWEACAGRTATVSYADHDKYVWLIADPAGGPAKISQSYILEGNPSYWCQRVVSAVSEAVIDVKACGENIVDAANLIVDKIAADITQSPAF